MEETEEETGKNLCRNFKVNGMEFIKEINKWNTMELGKNLWSKLGIECEGIEEVIYGRNWEVIFGKRLA